MTATERLYIYDTTLRDGQQTQGVTFSLEDKNRISNLLDNLGVDYIEGGWPGANPTDSDFFDQKNSFINAKLVAFGMTKRFGRSAENDEVLSEIVNSRTSVVCLVGKSHEFHVKQALGISLEENMELIVSSISYLKSLGKEVHFDAEHFFDGFLSDPQYSTRIVQEALNAGAKWVILCDTNGGCMPDQIYSTVQELSKAGLDTNKLGIHAHNDTENAVANSLIAIQAGVRQVQGTINGLGERCGNANLISLIPSLTLKKTFNDKFEIKINKDKVKTLTQCSRLLDEILNKKSNRRAAYVGPSAFAHKGGLHVSAVSKDPKTYEHIDPILVGNERNIIVSDQAGKSNIMSRLEKYGIKIDKNDPKVQKLLNEVKDREFVGYSYDGADASFELLARRLLGEIPKYLTISKYDVSVKKDSKDKIVSHAKAHIMVDGKEIVCEGTGNGPVNALDNAIRSNVDKVGKYSKYLKDLKLVDYKVRILNTGTNATTRVSIESTDSEGKSWFTIGVSPNIIEASFKALIDSLDYKLYKEKAPANN